MVLQFDLHVGDVVVAYGEDAVFIPPDIPIPRLVRNVVLELETFV